MINELTLEQINALQRLISKTKMNHKFGCWDFTGLLDKNGYGKLRMKNESAAHRVSYILFHGKIPKGLDISHDCDNPKCVNPKHLMALTRRENLKDAVKRGRIKTGIDHKYAVIKRESLDEILRLNKKGWSHPKIARKFNVSPETIRRYILKNK